MVGALVVGLADARMLIVRRRIDCAEAETDDATPADALLAFPVIAFLGLPGAFARRLSL